MKEDKFGTKRWIGLGLLSGSVVGMILFNVFGWETNYFFYLSGGWGLGMLL